MWAQQLVAPGRFEVVEAAAPRPSDLGPGEILIEVEGGAICGSDIPFFLGRRSRKFEDRSPAAAGRPGFPLHEVCGRVVAGEDPALPPGTRVVGWATASTALADLVVTRGDSVLSVPDGLETSTALTVQPLACVTAALARLGDLADSHVAVLGLGPFGMLFAHALRARGVRRLTGIDRVDRRVRVEDFGLDQVLWTSADRWAATLAEDDRPDVVVEAIGHQAGVVNDAIRALAPGGTLFSFGVPDEPVYPVEWELVFRKHLTLTGGVTQDRRDALRRALAHLTASPSLNERFVTDVLPMSRAQEAFELAARPAPGHLKVQLLHTGDRAGR